MYCNSININSERLKLGWHLNINLLAIVDLLLKMIKFLATISYQLIV